MSIFRDLPQPIPVYTDPAMRHWNRYCCRRQEDPVVFYRKDVPPMFLIKRVSAPGSTFTITFRQVGSAATFSPGISFNIATVGGYDYIWPSAYTNIPTMVCASYDTEVTDGTTTWYLERINLTDRWSNMTKWSFGDDCARGGIPFGEMSGARFSFYLETELGEPATSTEEQIIDDGATRTVTSSLTTRKTLLNDALPEYIVDAFHCMKHCTNVQLSVPIGQHAAGVEDPVMTFQIRVLDITTDYLRTGCLTDSRIYFSHTEDWRTACCDEALVAEECYPEEVTNVDFAVTEDDGTWFEANASPGQTALVTNLPIASGSLSGNNGKIATWDGATITLESATPGQFYAPAVDHITGQTPPGIYVRAGSPTFVNIAPAPLSISEDAGTITVVGYGAVVAYLPGRFVRIIAGTGCTDGVLEDEATVVIGTEADYIDEGLSFEQGEYTHFVVEYYTHNCDFGRTPCIHIEAEIAPPDS